jgi:hypothetical protein
MIIRSGITITFSIGSTTPACRKFIERGVKRYAIVVETEIRPVFENFAELDSTEDEIAVEYFTNVDEAQQWIES